MKKNQVEEFLNRKNFRKQMVKTLSVTMAVSMVAGQPMAVLADSTVNKDQTAIVADGTEQTAEEPAAEAPAVEATEETEEITEEAAAVTEVSQTETEALAADASVYTEDMITIPLAEMPQLEAGKRYTVPFRMYSASSVKEGADGQVHGQYSMGEFCLESNDAEIQLDEDGNARIKIRLLADSACTAFNYFNSKEDFETYKNAEEYYLPEFQALKKGGNPLKPKDGVEYTYEATDTYYPCDEALTSITFTAPTTGSMIYFSVCAMGMNDGMTEQFGVLGFDYENLKEVEKPEHVKNLTSVVKECKGINNENRSYTEGSFRDLQKAIENAEKLLASEELSEEEATEAIAALNEAKANLVVLTELKAVIDEADKKLKETDKYTAASLSVLKEELNFAKTRYYEEKNKQKTIDEAQKSLQNVLDTLVPVSNADLDLNNLQDGTYKVAVNLWHATQDKESMGNEALDHTAILTVKDGVYSLRLNGFPMTIGKQTG